MESWKMCKKLVAKGVHVCVRVCVCEAQNGVIIASLATADNKPPTCLHPDNKSNNVAADVYTDGLSGAVGYADWGAVVAVRLN